MNKIIIIDDSIELLEVLKFFLEKNGYQVMILSHLGNFLDKIKNFQPDLIILDVLISGKDGREICLELKRNDESKKLCILLFSASPEHLKDYLLCEADDILEKPFNLTVLLQKVKEVLKTCSEAPNKV